MEHLDDQQLGRYLDDELSDIERSHVEGHLDDCERCRAEVDRLRETSDRLNALIEEVELPERLREADVSPDTGRARGEAGGRSMPLRAAAIAAALLLTASAVVPGSPVRSWIGEAAARVGAAFVAEEELAEAGPAAFGLQIRPANGRVRVRIRGAAPGTRLSVRLVEDSLAGAWAPGARFRSRSGRLEVVEPEGGTVRIEVPRSARRSVVRAGGRTLFRWDGRQVVVPTSSPDSGDGVYRFRLGAGGGP